MTMSAARRAPLNTVDISLYGATVLAWAFSWIGMHYQLGPVAPEVSVVWRFVIAAPVMMLLARLRGEPLAFPPADHLRFAALGLFLFCLNFVLYYSASAHVVSGLLSVVFSLASIVNVGMGAVVLGAPIDRRVVIGGAFGAVGVALMFFRQAGGGGQDGALAGLAMAFAGTLSFCTGNMISVRLQRRRIPAVSASAWGMAYGAAMLAGLAVLRGHAFVIDPNPVYLGALAYLAIVATVVAFACYLTLLGRIGADRAAYVTVLAPVLALCVSTLAEGYRWSGMAVVGLAAVLVGNLLVLRPPRT
jgi:drug/metabolite transporter (DMT)-like permease